MWDISEAKRLNPAARVFVPGSNSSSTTTCGDWPTTAMGYTTGTERVAGLFAAAAAAERNAAMSQKEVPPPPDSWAWRQPTAKEAVFGARHGGPGQSQPKRRPATHSCQRWETKASADHLLGAARRAAAEACTPTVQVDCTTFALTKPVPDNELKRLACETLLGSGFKQRDILRTELNSTRTKCFVEVSLTAGGT